MQPYIERVENAISDLRAGKMIVLTDHPEREDEGDIIFPAEIITPEVINFMIRHCSGIICLSLPEAQVKQLGLSYMVPSVENTSKCQTPFTESIDAKDGITTGVSAKDRATTILAAVNEKATSGDIVKPGHIFPLMAQAGGILQRQGHTEGAVDIARLAGFKPAAVLCEIMNPDGTMSSGDKLLAFAAEHQLSVLSIDDLIAYRLGHENMIEEEISSELPLKQYGAFKITVIREKYTAKEHLILTSRNQLSDNPLVRIHSACITGDLFGSQRCDCSKQLDYSLSRIAEEGGMLIYLNQEGRGIGIFNKIKAYALQEHGLDTVEANEKLGLPVDARDYYIAANVLRNKGISKIRLLTNNPHKAACLKKYGIENIAIENIPLFSNEHNSQYLQTKMEKLDHQMAFQE
jgi:3,4-dihydroxy 2-butanone 4-phosphate synthase/GTP cyclohydrolase II